MGRSQESYGKREKEKKRLKKREDKQAKREERKESPKADFKSMISYVDEFGNPTDTPPDLSKRAEINVEDIEIGVPKREKQEEDALRTGKVDFFNGEKGFGFINEDDTGERFFVHISELNEDVVEGDKVAFEVERGLKGPNAVRVNKV